MPQSRKVTCVRCEQGELEAVEGEEGGVVGFLCSRAHQFEPNQGCNVLVSQGDFDDMLTMLQAEPKACPSQVSQHVNRPPAIPGKAKERGEGGGEDGDDDEEDEEDAGEEEEEEGEDDDDEEFFSQPVTSKKDVKQNIDALVRGTLVVQRQPMMLGLSLRGANNAASRLRFKPPERTKPMPKHLMPDTPRLRGTLGVRRRFFNGPFPQHTITPAEEEAAEEEEQAEEPVKTVVVEHDKDKEPSYEPLVLWEPAPEQLADAEKEYCRIEVEPFVCKCLREHQREGVKFMAECVLEQCVFEGAGCILADDMGLGKTLQSVALMYTLLTQGFQRGAPVVRRAIVVCPTSLVSNWKNEISKWTGERLTVVALSESSKDAVVSGIEDFLSPHTPSRVLIISYETFRLHRSRFDVANACDLLICDEAHRLKNAETATYKTLASLDCRRRILLSGTPMQNDLDEFFAMVDFANPGVLGDRRQYHKQYVSPILSGREPGATDIESRLGAERSQELSARVNMFILRRTNVLLSKHLPPKVVQIVCCRLAPMQRQLYHELLKATAIRKLLREKDEGSVDLEHQQHGVLPLIGALKKLCNHPQLVYDDLRSQSLRSVAAALEATFPPDFRRLPFDPTLSGKLDVLDRLLCHVRRTTNDRVVLVSNYTQTLEVFGSLCRLRGWQFLRLDGSTTVKKRQKLVDQLSDTSQNYFAFLLSSKAGGCGLNLVGANRLILFDPDWNPAVDKQAAARVWRDGQKKRCYIYRFLTTGTIEEKVFQRQISKEGLQNVIGGAAKDATVSREELRDLFSLLEDTRSDTHDTLDCECCNPIDGENLRRMKSLEIAPLGASTGDGGTDEEGDDGGPDQPVVDKDWKEGDGESEDEDEDEEEGEDDDEDESESEGQGDGSESKSESEGESESESAGDDEEDGGGGGRGGRGGRGKGAVRGRGGKGRGRGRERRGAQGQEQAGEQDDGAQQKDKRKSRAQEKREREELEKQRKAKLPPRQLGCVQHVQKPVKMQRGFPSEEDLFAWSHHVTSRTSPDPCLRMCRRGAKSDEFKDFPPRPPSPDGRKHAALMSPASAKPTIGARGLGMRRSVRSPGALGVGGFSPMLMKQREQTNKKDEAKDEDGGPGGAREGGEEGEAEGEGEHGEDSVTFVFALEVVGRTISEQEDSYAKFFTACAASDEISSDEEGDDEKERQNESECEGAASEGENRSSQNVAAVMKGESESDGENGAKRPSPPSGKPKEKVRARGKLKGETAATVGPQGPPRIRLKKDLLAMQAAAGAPMPAKAQDPQPEGEPAAGSEGDPSGSEGENENEKESETAAAAADDDHGQGQDGTVEQAAEDSKAPKKRGRKSDAAAAPKQQGKKKSRTANGASSPSVVSSSNGDNHAEQESGRRRSHRERQGNVRHRVYDTPAAEHENVENPLPSLLPLPRSLANSSGELDASLRKRQREAKEVEVSSASDESSLGTSSEDGEQRDGEDEGDDDDGIVEVKIAPRKKAKNGWSAPNVPSDDDFQ